MHVRRKECSWAEAPPRGKAQLDGWGLWSEGPEAKRRRVKDVKSRSISELLANPKESADKLFTAAKEISMKMEALELYRSQLVALANALIGGPGEIKR